ncbi:hypothetical protein BJP06_06295 [Corynebacterium sp. NML120713]|nr:hypothetical protein BJP06_06295 [Corynebacterium sp. NML120713]
MTSFTHNAHELLTALDETRRYAEQKDHSLGLNTVWFEETAESKLRLVATDRFKVAMTLVGKGNPLYRPDETGDSARVSIESCKGLVAWLKAIGGGKKSCSTEVTVTLKDGQVSASSAGNTWSDSLWSDGGKDRPRLAVLFERVDTTTNRPCINATHVGGRKGTFVYPPASGDGNPCLVASNVANLLGMIMPCRSLPR